MTADQPSRKSNLDRRDLWILMITLAAALIHGLGRGRGIPGSGLPFAKVHSRHLERGPLRRDHRRACLFAASAPQDGGEDEAGGEANPEADECRNHGFMVVP